jgi:catechol 2,3-dioxygenase-like lactoylglutathione lyase family enzyme
MRLNTVRIPCRNWNDAERFYALLLNSQPSFGSPADGYLGFVIDNVNILLEPEESAGFQCGRYLGFSLEVPAIAAFHANMQAQGVKFLGPPERQFWGGIMAHVEDPDGNSFSIVQVSNL